MSRPRANTKKLHISLAAEVFDQLQLTLFSTVEGRIPHAAQGDLIEALLRRHFADKALDLAPWSGRDPGLHIVRGDRAALEVLQRCLTGDLPA